MHGISGVGWQSRSTRRRQHNITHDERCDPSSFSLKTFFFSCASLLLHIQKHWVKLKGKGETCVRIIFTKLAWQAGENCRGNNVCAWSFLFVFSFVVLAWQCNSKNAWILVRLLDKVYSCIYLLRLDLI